jgi:hypothetical protein
VFFGGGEGYNVDNISADSENSYGYGSEVVGESHVAYINSNSTRNECGKHCGGVSGKASSDGCGAIDSRDVQDSVETHGSANII